jgi:carbonic anhydrase/acetyltransferase-like protein (isoleucine patch superfamily)
MDVTAILLVGVQQPGIDSSGVAPEFVTGSPIASVDVLGKPVLVRIADNLLGGGVTKLAVIADSATPGAAAIRQSLDRSVAFTCASGANLWRACENMFQDFTQAGAELVIVWRVGAYAEIDADHLTQFHLDQRSRVTPVVDENGASLDIYVISASRRNDAAYLFRHQLADTRMPCNPYVFSGYVNRLRNARDLRQLTLDALMQRNQISPVGAEIKPGIWAGEGARIARGARVLAPAYIGAHAKIRSTAVITRGSAIEHHAEVDCGTVVDGSNILPFTYVGAGLDVTTAIVGNARLAHLRRDVELEVADPKLIGMKPQQAPWRAVSAATSLVTFLPKQIVRGFTARPERQACAPTLPEAVKAPSAALRESAALQPGPSQFPSS